MKKKMLVIKIILTAAVVLGLSAVMLVLTHSAGDYRKETRLCPDVVDNPLYIAWEKGQPLDITISPKEDFMAGSFLVLLVNVSEESQGKIQLQVTDEQGGILDSQQISAAEITPGEWVEIPMALFFEAGRHYQLTFLAEESEPYFMQVPVLGDERLPFTMQVENHGEEVTGSVSLGVLVTEQQRLAYGDIFYFSIPLSIISSLFVLLCIWQGWKKVLAELSLIGSKLGKGFACYGSDLFLILLFLFLCIYIYVKAYCEGIYISSDSAGYLREAVNLAAGNGFHYDGMAGYTSWFANWPIVYPAMIAGMMLLTGSNAYLASKMVSMVLVGIILILLRIYFRKDAWLYGICLLNPGFLELACYTWSEIPFILFLLGFGLVFTQILKRETTSGVWYILLGCMELLGFLTRYFGMFLWMVAGLYLCYYLVRYLKDRDKICGKKFLLLTVTSGISGVLGVGYLAVNKWKNGMASGVSRTMWWDDYRSLTNDLIESLLTEIGNAFLIRIPQFIEELSYSLKALVLIAVLLGLIWFICRNYQAFTWQSVLIVMWTVYMGSFIVIRYFSSMDTFYFRFFEPASFLLSMALLGYLLPCLKGKRGYHYFAGMITVLIIFSSFSMVKGQMEKSGDDYYELIIAGWEKDYEEIPERSVVIFNDIDYRSAWYRPDVADGLVTPADTWEDLIKSYYGSENLCIKAEFAEEMLESGEYHETVRERLSGSMEKPGVGDRYLVIPLG